MEDHNPLAAALDALKVAQTTSESNVERLRAELARSLSAVQFCTVLQNHLRRGWYCSVLDLLRREARLIALLGAQNQEVRVALEEITREADRQASATLRRFATLFERAADGKMDLDEASRHPRYTIDKGFFTVDVSEQTCMARLSDYGGKLDDLPADPECIVEAVQREHSRVFERKLDKLRLLKTLRKEYLAAHKSLPESDGGSIPIRDIMRGTKKTLKLREDEFIVDLSRLVEQGPLRIDGRTLDLQQTREAKQGLLLWGARGYVGYVVFRKGDV